MYKVELMSHTPDALNLLLRTKNTRLKNTDDPKSWSEAKRREHLDYMRDTIKSSWEFVDYTFEISGVTRAFTHQLVRTRQGSYAQESQRTVDVSGADIDVPEAIADDAQLSLLFQSASNLSMSVYKDLMKAGVPAQDARGILPTNTTTSIIAKYNLRTLHEMAKVRLCERTQGEYQRVFRQMRERVIEVHPWADEFIQVHCVATGTCAFPRYGKASCRYYDPRMNLDALKEELAVKFWAKDGISVAVPVANNGKTM